jgi:hypothetical protein
MTLATLDFGEVLITGIVDPDLLRHIIHVRIGSIVSAIQRTEGFCGAKEEEPDDDQAFKCPSMRASHQLVPSDFRSPSEEKPKGTNSLGDRRAALGRFFLRISNVKIQTTALNHLVLQEACRSTFHVISDCSSFRRRIPVSIMWEKVPKVGIVDHTESNDNFISGFSRATGIQPKITNATEDQTRLQSPRNKQKGIPVTAKIPCIFSGA